jgi:Spy/CpxP family protein refolding chaperone
MKRILSFSIMILMIALITSNAQPRRTPEERAKMLKDSLNLTDKQTSKIEAIYTASDPKFQEAFQNGFDREKFRSLMDSTNAEIEKVLTDKQNEKFQKLLEERRNRMRQNSPNQN